MKSNGKSICKELKAIRLRVAEANGIALELPWQSDDGQQPRIGDECKYEGACDGTCPRCEAEVRYLEQELHRRTALGKAAAVAGVAMTLATFSACTTEGDVDILDGDPSPEQVDTTSGATHQDTDKTTIAYQ